jgi:hypothetical protein
MSSDARTPAPGGWSPDPRLAARPRRDGWSGRPRCSPWGRSLPIERTTASLELRPSRIWTRAPAFRRTPSAWRFTRALTFARFGGPRGAGSGGMPAPWPGPGGVHRPRIAGHVTVMGAKGRAPAAGCRPCLPSPGWPSGDRVCSERTAAVRRPSIPLSRGTDREDHHGDL